MKKCPVLNCSTYTLRKSGFYRIPEHPGRRKAWIQATGLPVDCPHTTVICWKHFKKSDFVKEISLTDVGECTFGQLQRNVVPSQNLPYDLYERSKKMSFQLTKNAPNYQKNSTNEANDENSELTETPEINPMDFCQVDINMEAPDSDENNEETIKMHIKQEVPEIENTDEDEDNEENPTQMHIKQEPVDY